MFGRFAKNRVISEINNEFITQNIFTIRYQWPYPRFPWIGQNVVACSTLESDLYHNVYYVCHLLGSMQKTCTKRVRLQRRSSSGEEFPMRTLWQAFCVGCLAKRTYVSEARGCEVENWGGQTSQWVSAIIFAKYMAAKLTEMYHPIKNICG